MTRWYRHPASGAVVLTAAAFVGVVSAAPGGARLTAAVCATAALTALAAGVAALLRSASRPGRMRWCWLGVALGALSYGAGEAVQTVHPAATAVTGLGHLGLVPLTAAGLLTVPVAHRSVAGCVRGVVDGLLIAVSLVLVSWMFVLHPLLRDGGGPPLGRPGSMAGPIGDVVLAAVALSVLAKLRRGGPDPAPLMLVSGAMVLIGLSDSLSATVTLTGGLPAANGPGIGRIAGFALVLLAARRNGTPAAAPAGEHQPFAVLVPYATVLTALLASVVWYASTGTADAFFGCSRTALILLIVARQLLTLLENRRLTAHLESRVAARTAELYAREQRFRALVRQSSESVAVIDADSTVRYQSESIERILGLPADEVVGINLIAAVDAGTAALIRSAIAEVSRQPYATTVIDVTFRHRRTGRPTPTEMTLTNLLDDPSVHGIVLNTRDVSEARELQARLVRAAYHDGLTRLASRELFRQNLADAIARAAAPADVAVLFLDLDGFKEVNDSLGHAAGDQLLVMVADRLRAAVRATDLVARFGGDEFAVLVESIGARADAETVGARIVAAVAGAFAVDGRELRVGASIGLASAADAAGVEQLMRNADLAMYEAKSGGGGRLAAYDPRMHLALVRRLELESDLRQALDRDELALHYQPTVDLATGEIAGFEALVRWHHPAHGIVPPLDFIPLAEATGLIGPLGRWVLAEACRQAVAWGFTADRPWTMAVNVSVRQFDQGDLAATVSEVLAETGLPAASLTLEMTESVLLTDTEENLTQLLRLKQLGVTLAMDDFGTGYSSLAYLGRFPMDVLKIDRSFVDRLGGDTEDVALVRTITRLGRSLGLTTVAEGVETRVQLDALREIGCDFGQGYHLSRPVPAPEAGRLLRDGLPAAIRPVPA